MAGWQERLRTVQAVALVAVVVLVAWARTRSPGRPATTSFPHFRAARVAAAADLRFALKEIGAAYESTHPNIEAPQMTYGSSGTLYAQIQNGAPFDLFLSADAAYPRALAKAGKADADTLINYASGALAIWVRAGSRLDFDRLGLAALGDEAVAHVAIANPAHAPYGRAAEEAIDEAGMSDRLKARLVLGENVAQALQFAQSGAADAAIVALSLVRAPEAAESGRAWTVPRDSYAPIEQWGVALRTERTDQARDFERFLRSDAARAILVRYGFAVPDR